MYLENKPEKFFSNKLKPYFVAPHSKQIPDECDINEWKQKLWMKAKSHR